MAYVMAADPAGRLIWVSPTLPGSRHDMAAAREHGILDAIDTRRSTRWPDTGYQGAGPTVRYRNAAASTRTPAATGGCRRTRMTSTPHTPASADRASALTPS